MTDYANLRKIVTGDIIVKCKLGDEIRRIPINQEPTYDELCLMMCRVFKGRISVPEKITLKYTDDEGDLINLADDIDISHAISLSNILKITVYDHQEANNNAPHLALNHSTEVQATLIKMRDTINGLIESLSITEVGTPEKKENTPSIRKLTPSQMDAFLNDTKKENAEKSSTKEQNTTTPETTSSFTPYYPPPPSQQKQQSIQAPQPQQQNINAAQQQQIKSPPTGSQPPSNAQQQIHHVPPHMQPGPPPVQQVPVNHQTQPPPPSTPQQYQHVNPTFQQQQPQQQQQQQPQQQQQQQPQQQQYQGNVGPGYPNPHNPQQPQQQRPVYYVPPPPNRNTQVGPPPSSFHPPQW